MERKTFKELHEKAMRLPLSPGVYIMRSSSGKIIYVGKSKALRNRVSQYFQDNAKNAKTEAMVNSVWDLDYMLTDTEIEALALENKLIKLHNPKYNILLKDGKSYPYIKVSFDEEYPRVYVTRRRTSGKSKYFGPYSSAQKAREVVNAVNTVFKLPTCKRTFPKDIGKSRPCIYMDIGRCCALCTGNISKDEYRERFDEVCDFLKGNFDGVIASLKEKMDLSSKTLAFEAAAKYRDRISALSMLREKQKVIGKPEDEFDIISMYQSDLCSCIAIYNVRGGAVMDSDNIIIGADRIIDDSAIESFIFEFYQRREDIPSLIYVGIPLDAETLSDISDFLKEASGCNVQVKIPVRGEYKKMCDMVSENAMIHAKEYAGEAEKDNEILSRVANLLSLDCLPDNIEAIDISNYGNDNITAGIISLKNGKFNKNNYRLYKIRSTEIQNDYASMKEAVLRRIGHSSEVPLPDILLLDGGVGHVSVIKAALVEAGVDLPVFGMVKDEFHKTRAITDGEREIGIARDFSVYSFFFRIQEEVHRFTVKAAESGKRKTLSHSSLEKIEGIGPAKAKILLAHFKSIKALKEASVDEIAAVGRISRDNAEKIREYFDKN